MKYNKGFTPVMLLWVVLGIAIVGGGVIYVVNKHASDAISETQNQQKEKSAATVSCNPGDRPSITVLSPNGGETYVPGQQITVKWKSCSVTAPISIILLKHDNSPYMQSENGTDYAGFILGGFDPYIGTEDDGIQQVTLPTSADSHLTLGQHYFISVSGQDEPSIGLGFSARDLSDSLFSIQ